MTDATDTAIIQAAEQRIAKQLKGFDDMFDNTQSVSSKQISKGEHWS